MPMDPLIEVSTVGGKNMRETCARALAAALLTGAIATVVGMAAHLGTPSTAGGPIAAPPSLPQHSVHLTVQPVRAAPPRLVTAQTTSVRPRPAAVTRSLVVVHRRSTRRPPARRELAATTPAPQPVAPPAPAPAPAPPAPAPAQATQQPPPAQDDQGDDHGHGHGRGHGRGEQDD